MGGEEYALNDVYCGFKERSFIVIKIHFNFLFEDFFFKWQIYIKMILQR
jgi:hypothetical protein